MKGIIFNLHLSFIIWIQFFGYLLNSFHSNIITFFLIIIINRIILFLFNFKN